MALSGVLLARGCPDSATLGVLLLCGEPYSNGMVREAWGYLFVFDVFLRCLHFGCCLLLVDDMGAAPSLLLGGARSQPTVPGTWFFVWASPAVCCCRFLTLVHYLGCRLLLTSSLPCQHLYHLGCVLEGWACSGPRAWSWQTPYARPPGVGRCVRDGRSLLHSWILAYGSTSFEFCSFWCAC